MAYCKIERNIYKSLGTYIIGISNHTKFNNDFKNLLQKYDFRISILNSKEIHFNMIS